MAAAPGDDDPLDRRLAHAAGLALAPVNPVLELEETFFAIGIHVVGNAGAAQLDGFFQNCFQGLMQAPKLVSGERGSAATGPNAGSEQSFIGVDVSHPAQQALIEQRALDRSLASVEQGGEILK